MVLQSFFNTGNCLMHVLHQERIMKLFQTGTKEAACLFECGHTALHQERSDDGIDIQFCSKVFNNFYIIIISNYPTFLFHLFLVANIHKFP